jgi:hypothetical protein
LNSSEFDTEHSGGQPDKDLTGAVDHPRRHVDQPAPDELEVVGLDALGRGVTEVFLLDRLGDPFAQPAQVAGSDDDGEHGDPVVGDHDGGLPGPAAASRMGRWISPQPFLASLILSST